MSYKFKYGTHEIEVPKRSESLCYQYDLGANVNLNNLTNEGYYHQSANVNTSLALNYPTAEAGLLTVIHRNYIYQTYQTYNNSGFWYRSYYDGTWYAWKKVPDINGDTFNGIVNGYYFNASHNQGLRSNGIEIIYGNNGITYLPNQNVVINNSLDVSKGVDVRGTLYSHGDCWLGAQFSTTGWLGFYNAYGGTRKAWIGHNGTNTFSIIANDNLSYGSGLNFEAGSSTYPNGHIYPQGNGGCTLGIASRRWFRLYQSYGSIDTSDEREKHDIMSIKDAPTTFSSKEGNVYEQLFNKLTPKIYGRNHEADEIENNRIHIGFVAQDIAKLLGELGIKENQIGIIDHSFWIDEKTGEEKDLYGLCYSEFIALNTHMIQKLLTNFKQQQEEINVLKKDIDELKKKFIKQK
ncbi:MAG: pyocin knob domain-containing S74 family peptidase [Longibaculum sp.]